MKWLLHERYKVLALLVVALTITGALAAASMLSPSHADTTGTTTKTITVSGTGTVTGMPDTYTVAFSVVGVDVNAATATDKANSVYEALVSTLQSAGYNFSLLTLSSMNIYPEYYYPSSGPAVFQDYRVTYALQYEESLNSPTPLALGTKAAGVVMAAVKAGVSNVGGVSFSLSDSATASLQTQALAQATADAKAKANVIASGLGVSITGVQSAQTTVSYTPPVYYGAYALDAGANPQFNAGPATESAQVTVTFLIA